MKRKSMEKRMSCWLGVGGQAVGEGGPGLPPR